MKGNGSKTISSSKKEIKTSFQVIVVSFKYILKQRIGFFFRFSFKRIFFNITNTNWSTFISGANSN